MDQQQKDAARALWNNVRSNIRVLATGIARGRNINLDIDDTSRPRIVRYVFSYPTQRCGTIYFDEETNLIGWQVGDDRRAFLCDGERLIQGGEAFSLHDISREFLGHLFGIVPTR